MGSFDDFMIGQTTRQSEELRRTQQELRGVEAQRDALAASHAELLDALERLFYTLSPEIPGSPGSAIERARTALTRAKALV